MLDWYPYSTRRRQSLEEVVKISVLGRFVSADTIVPQPGSPLDWDRYLFVRGNPLTYIDPSGHDPTCTLATDDGYCVQWSDKIQRHNPGVTTPLMEEGKKIKALFYRWRETFGQLSIKQFFGWMMSFEMNGLQDISTTLDGVSTTVLELMIEVVARQLWSDATQAGGHAPYCQNSSCTNGLFNFLGKYTQVARKRANAASINPLDYPTGYQDPNGPPYEMYHEKLLRDSEAFTRAVLNPKPEWKL